MKEAILCNDVHERHAISEEILSSSDETFCGLPITDLATPSTSNPLAKETTQPPSGASPSHRLPTPPPILTPHSPLQSSTSNRFNNDLSSGDTTHSLTINISEKSAYRKEHGSSSSSNHSHSASKKKDKKTKLDNPPRKPSVMPSEPVKGQKIIKAAIEAMKRKLSPEKESDTIQDKKMSRSENSDT